MAQTLTKLMVHAVFSTKHREDLIPAEIEPRLYAYIGGICRNADSDLLCAGGTANHVHLLIRMSKNIALAALMQDIKRDTSKWIKEVGPGLEGFHWQEGYAAFSVGESQVPALRAYLAKQKEHHRTNSFQEEVVEFLERYGVEYHPEHIWE
jgi:putative transposase